MSEHIVKIIASDPFAVIPETILAKAKEFLETNISCSCVSIEISKFPMFIDCGSNLESITCPECGSEITFDWWGEKMNEASECSFQKLDLELPCCKKSSSLNLLRYYYECGFSCLSIEILEPADDVSLSVISELENIIGNPLRIINSHM